MDCKVLVRTYFLVSRPSKWAQKGDRVVVQSPMRDLTNQSSVPVRRFKGDEANLVCFLSKEDIEKYSSDVYDKEGVSRSSRSINAHGVALLDSQHNFEYKLGDRFWIFIGADTAQYGTEVSVINLRTFAAGIIPISHVCWFPKMRGPDGELWTFGGATRKLKQAGPNQFTLWNWVISQNLDGTRTTTKEVLISDKDKYATDREWIDPAEGQSLFAQIFQTKVANVQYLNSPVSNYPQILNDPFSTFSESCLSRSSTLDMNSLNIINRDSSNPVTSVYTNPSKKSMTSIWQPIFREAGKLKNKALAPLRTSYIHTRPQKCVLSSSEGDAESLRYSNLEGTIRCPVREGSFASTQENSSSYTWEEMDAALLLTGLSRQRKVEPVVSAADICDDPIILTRAYEINKKHTIAFINSENSKKTQLCDQADENCQYINRWFGPHYHADPSKCRIREHHEHCVSSKHPSLNDDGPCILKGNGTNNHFCCCWSEIDRSILPGNPRSPYNDVKQIEAAPYFKLLDVREHLKSIDVHTELQWPKEVMSEFLDNNGASFLDDLDTGKADCELEDLLCIGKRSRSIASDIWPLTK